MTGFQSNGYLTGKLLVSMPQMSDPRFAKSVIYLCAHNEDGAMGLVINQLIKSFSFVDLLQQLEIPETETAGQIRVHFGGPVECSRGFVLHSSEYQQDGTMNVANSVAMTATVDILNDIANNAGPQSSLLALGYAGWGPGQLDDELQNNGWLVVDPDEDILFGENLMEKWEKAMSKLGVDPGLLSGEAGHA
ncbi:YqgE/AlgH family protein [Kiloniella laminariae]|uniref:YqgE/AlgH family protein n=1 Tax=Kiloniella laminariae TaxID=454162 RepID=UPI0003735CC6|nr:YqgE/AlgH family protein [Kiloniella laminariae]